MFTRPRNSNVTKRIKGFYQAVNEVVPDLMDDALCIELDDKICIYSPMGLPQFPLAIIGMQYKTKRPYLIENRKLIEELIELCWKKFHLK